VLEQAVRLRAPLLSGYACPRWARGWSTASPNLRELPRAIAEWASELSSCEALLEGVLTPGEHHFTVMTIDDGAEHVYFAHGQLWLHPNGTCRGSAIEAAPDGIQICITRGGRWTAGRPFALEPATALALAEGTPPELYHSERHAKIEFAYDYGGELYMYQLVARATLPPRLTDLSLASPLLPAGHTIRGPMALLTGRWWRQLEAEPSETERGRVHLMRLWRAEDTYVLLPDEPDALEDRLLQRTLSQMDLSPEATLADFT